MSYLQTAVLPLFVAGALALASAAPAQTAAQGEALAEALDRAAAESWPQAAAAAARAKSPVVDEIILWLRLREGAGGWAEYQTFLGDHADWPGLTPLRRRAERAMPGDMPANNVLGFFASEAPLTGTGALRLADALMATGRAASAQDGLQSAWREMSMTAEEMAAIEARYGSIVADQHVARIDMLLWRGLTAEARAMLPRVPADWQALARARIATRRDDAGVNAAIAAVPGPLKDDPGLAYERYLYRVEAGRWDDAEAFLRARSTSAAALGKPDLWMERRANLARTALRRGDAAAAYALAAANFGTADSGADYADAEWMAGYVALTEQDDPARAAAHFERFAAAVATPISLGRAGYWLGLARERAGDEAGAQAAFAAGARHQTSFYGQLAAERIGAAPDDRVAGEARAPDWRGQAFLQSSVVQAAQFFSAAGDDARAAQFLRHAAEVMDADQRGALAQMAIDLGLPHIGVRLAKDAAAQGMILPNQYYPVHDMAETDWPVPTELALAIARQESEFNPAAVSPAGARGLMQLMPGTARDVSGSLGIGYAASRLTSDPMYNARLGTAYLARMLADFDGSYVLAAAAYNAGPGRVNGWIDAYGDPRRGRVDPIVWIEAIPFEETRNYVMRVLESLHVYRARLSGAPEPIRLASDIERTG